MWFKKRKEDKNKKCHMNKWQEQNNEIAALQQEINERNGFGMPLCIVLTRLPQDTIVNVHFQKHYTNPYRNLTVSEAMEKLSFHEKQARVHRVSHDLDFGGPDKTRPIAILEIPSYF